MEIFKDQNILEFAERFKTDENCKDYPAISSGMIDSSVLCVIPHIKKISIKYSEL